MYIRADSSMAITKHVQTFFCSWTFAVYISRFILSEKSYLCQTKKPLRLWIMSWNWNLLYPNKQPRQQTECSPRSLLAVSGCLRASATLLSNLQYLSSKNRSKHSWRAKVNRPSTMKVLSTVVCEEEKPISSDGVLYRGCVRDTDRTF